MTATIKHVHDHIYDFNATDFLLFLFCSIFLKPVLFISHLSLLSMFSCYLFIYVLSYSVLYLLCFWGTSDHPHVPLITLPLPYLCLLFHEGFAQLIVYIFSSCTIE
jgi:hypothetical protein